LRSLSATPHGGMGGGRKSLKHRASKIFQQGRMSFAAVAVAASSDMLGVPVPSEANTADDQGSNDNSTSPVAVVGGGRPSALPGIGGGEDSLSTMRTRGAPRTSSIGGGGGPSSPFSSRRTRSTLVLADDVASAVVKFKSTASVTHLDDELADLQEEEQGVEGGGTPEDGVVPVLGVMGAAGGASGGGGAPIMNIEIQHATPRLSKRPSSGTLLPPSQVSSFNPAPGSTLTTPNLGTSGSKRNSVAVPVATPQPPALTYVDLLPDAEIGTLIRAFVAQPVMIQWQIQHLLVRDPPRGGIPFSGTTFERFVEILASIRNGDIALEYPEDILFQCPPETDHNSGGRRLRPVERLQWAQEEVWRKDGTEYRVTAMRNEIAHPPTSRRTRGVSTFAGLRGGRGTTANMLLGGRDSALLGGTSAEDDELLTDAAVLTRPSLPRRMLGGMSVWKSGPSRFRAMVNALLWSATFIRLSLSFCLSVFSSCYFSSTRDGTIQGRLIGYQEDARLRDQGDVDESNSFLLARLFHVLLEVDRK
ncbi:unnamed protein product, partial [Amoebophrya sp. A25]